MKIDFVALDRAILDALAKGPVRLDDFLRSEPIRKEALRLNIRRAGVSRSGSADTTVNERLQELRRKDLIGYDKATSRWYVVQASVSL